MTNHSSRPDQRPLDALRTTRIEVDPMKYAEGSALIETGDTKVLISASVEKQVPSFLRDSGKGWLTAEYSMLPRATSTRSTREVKRGKPSGRTSEIQRLIGRSLRAAVDLTAFPEKTITLDCDVLQADGGTRTASITGAYVAAALAFRKLLLTKEIDRWPLMRQVAAVSVGLVDGVELLDLEYVEDYAASVDMNVVGTPAGQLIEVQGTAEEGVFDRSQNDRLLDLAQAGIRRLGEAQDEALRPAMEEVAAAQNRANRPPAAPKNEADLWGRP